MTGNTAVGWTNATDWPQVSKEILAFVVNTTNRPEILENEVKAFASLPLSRGFQAGLLTPILNALNPDKLFILNNKSRRAVNYFTGATFKFSTLPIYSEANRTEHSLVESVSSTILALSSSDARSSDLFDMFCHWLYAVIKYPPIVGHRIKTEDGEVVVNVPEEQPDVAPAAVSSNAGIEPRPSYQIQAKLADIGAKMGFRIWVPRNDRQNVLALVARNKYGAFLECLPLNYDDLTLRTIEQIDVIWMKGRSMARAFEVEHTTAIYSGLLRMADLLALQPNMDIRLHIAAPNERRDKVRQEILRPTFSLLEHRPLYRSCSFLPYSAVEEMDSLPHLEHMNGSIVDDYAEKFEEDEDE
ncbi:MAG: hypothetical protein Q8922_15500 [Bacteroidota bacterium]|nr:hypothetical protein [Bacteroidota bacterium]MDP4234766.1 hypothetical protein [Bacteroidota bacterium]MDP4244157.1 hypothetical protein [Bacteroidota bacterium]MDP4289319.1 hypothetical protein [Bacteroidota bacterium]